MNEYRIISYPTQKMDINTLKPIGKVKTRYAIYKKYYPFPNKKYVYWDNIRGDFKTEKDALLYLETIKSPADTVTFG